MILILGSNFTYRYKIFHISTSLNNAALLKFYSSKISVKLLSGMSLLLHAISKYSMLLQ